MGFVIIANNANWECHFLRQIFFQKNNLIHNFAYRFAIIFVPKTLQTTAVQLCTKKHSNVSMNNLNIWRVNQNVLHLPLMGFIARKLDILHLTDLSTFCTRLHASIGFITRKLGVFFTNQAKLWKLLEVTLSFGTFRFFFRQINLQKRKPLIWRNFCEITAVAGFFVKSIYYDNVL